MAPSSMFSPVPTDAVPLNAVKYMVPELAMYPQVPRPCPKFCSGVGAAGAYLAGSTPMAMLAMAPPAVCAMAAPVRVNTTAMNACVPRMRPTADATDHPDAIDVTARVSAVPVMLDGCHSSCQ